MSKEKVTLTLDAASLAQVRAIAGSRSLSSAVDAALSAYVEKLRHLTAVDAWLADMERDHGPVSAETLEWAARAIDEWDEPTPRRRKAV